MNIDLNDLVVFTEVVQEGSFTAAGKKLSLPASAVSRRVARLEERLGFKLLNRTTRRIGLTDPGRIYFERTSKVVQDVRDAERALGALHEVPSGSLRVTAPPDDGGLIWNLLSGFVRAHPQVDLELIHTLDYVDMVEQSIDVALRGGAPPDSTLFAAHKLIESRLVLVASPDYIAARGQPKAPEDLAEHDCIGMDGWAPNAIRGLRGPDGKVRIKLRNRVRANRQETSRRAALDGFGIAPIVERTCERELRDGRLVEVLPGVFPDPANFWLVYPIGRPVSAAARSLVQHLVGPIRADVASAT